MGQGERMSAPPLLADARYRASIQARPVWPVTNLDLPLLPDPTAPTLSRFLPVYRDALARTTGRRDGRG